jgi:hypothetical protein
MRRGSTLLLLLCWAAASGAERTPGGRRPGAWWKRAWVASIGAMVAANVADAHSSWGHPERNELLRSGGGMFGARAVAIKSGITGAAIGMQWITARKVPRARPALAVANAVTAAALGHAAANNYRVRGSLRAAPRAPYLGAYLKFDSPY